jgi:hypothetical protein
MPGPPLRQRWTGAVTLWLILHQRFTAKVHQGFTAKAHHGFTAKVHQAG